jgi:hypothetical protein
MTIITALRPDPNPGSRVSQLIPTLRELVPCRDRAVSSAVDVHHPAASQCVHGVLI